MLSVLTLLMSERFAAVASGCSKAFFGLIPWYQYLDVSIDSTTGRCEIKNFTTLAAGHPSSFLLIALAILEDLVRIAGLVAVGFVIVGGINYITSQGSPENTKNAQNTIINALAGLVIALFAATVVAFLGNRIGG